MKFKVFSLLCCLVAVIQGHLLPQALEDVHSYVQKELSQRSQGNHSNQKKSQNNYLKFLNLLFYFSV